jgi:hypothetical protein
MNNIKKDLVCFVAGSMLFFINTGCKKLADFGDTNVNPNGSSSVLTSALITNVESQLGTITSNLTASYFCQYFSEATYPGASRYNLPQFNSTPTYYGPLMDAQVVINKNTDPETAGKPNVASGGANKSQIAVAMILKSYIFWTLTDRYGDLPYSEALKGTAILNPKYDEQLDIYKGILNDLAVANTTFDETGVTVKGDIIYNGNIAQWRKLSNSLRMLVAQRLSKRFPDASEYAATQFQAAYNSPYEYISSNADNFTVVYPGGNYPNPWNAVGASSDNGVSKTYVDILTGLSDPRLINMATNTLGIPYGLDVAYPQNPAFAKIFSPEYRTEASAQIIVGASSVLLAIAEARETGWVPGDAKAAYDMGVSLSFAQWGQSVPGAYLTTGPANYNTGAGVASIGGASVPGSNALTPNKRARIALQQYIAFYPDGIQGWSSWRRSEQIAGIPDRGVPDIRPTIFNTNTSGKIPRRFVYGTSEYSFNNTKLMAALQRLPGGDIQDERVWWDKKP